MVGLATCATVESRMSIASASSSPVIAIHACRVSVVSAVPDMYVSSKGAVALSKRRDARSLQSHDPLSGKRSCDAARMQESLALDHLDRQLVHALQIDGRVRFARLAQILGVSGPTVARRYARLRREAGLRVIGQPAPHRVGGARWFLRLTTMPSVAERVGQALARRDDTSYVQLTSGGTEITALIDAANDDGPAGLLLQDLPRTAGITGISAHYVLHQYRGGPSAWPGRLAALDPDHLRALTVERPVESFTASPDDAVLLRELARDGRVSAEAVAATTRRSPSSVSRRIAQLVASGAVYFDVDLDPAHLGVRARALLWMRVAPAHADSVGRALAEHAELAFVAATTGPSNLIASALCTSTDALHAYLVGPLAGHPIDRLETTPVLRTIKTIGTTMATISRRTSSARKP